MFVEERQRSQGTRKGVREPTVQMWKVLLAGEIKYSGKRQSKHQGQICLEAWRENCRENAAD